METVIDIDYFIAELKKHGIIIQRYNSITTNSTYLKLDYGVLNTVRISDHTGKKNLHYRYNIQSDLEKYRYDRTTKRFYYPAEQLDNLIQQILGDRFDRKTRYGSQYEVYMQNNVQENSHKNGFWSESWLV